MRKTANGLLLLAALVGLSGPAACAQDAAADKLRALCSSPDSESLHTFYLTNATQQNDANEIQTAIRNMLPPQVKIYLVPSQNALTICASPEIRAMAQKLIHDLDRPKKSYRLTYTTTELDSGKRVGTQHFSMVVVSGQRTVMKQGSKVPVATGSLSPGNSSVQTQFTYLDIGMNFDATLSEAGSGAILKTKVEQTNIAEEKSGVGPQDPVVRQTSLEGTSILTLNKPLVLGSLDVPGSTRHTDVEVMIEEVR